MSSYVNNQTADIASSTGTLGSSTGRVVFTNTSNQVAYLCIVQNLITTTATAGNRNLGYVIKDSAGNRLWQVNSPAVTAASIGQQLNVGAGATLSNAGGAYVLPIPSPMPLMPGATITVFDAANIDVNDSVTSGQIIVQY